MASSIHNPVYRDLIERLTAARVAAGLTQQSVADSLAKPQSYVAKIEMLERRIDVLEYFALARTIGFDPTLELKRAWGRFSRSAKSK